MRRARATIVGGMCVLAATCWAACRRPGTNRAAEAGSPTPDAGASARSVLSEIDRVEDIRRAPDVTPEWQISPDAVVRARATRALARIAEAPIEPAVEASLMRALVDEDPDVVGWAAYGLGWACKGREDEHLRALGARAATLKDADSSVGPAERGSLNPHAAIARAVGRCGGALAESVLSSLLRGGLADRQAEDVAYALGDIAARGPLSDEAIGLLLDRVTTDPSLPSASAALYAIGRLDRVPPSWTARVLAGARAVLATSSPDRAMAVKALERTGAEAVHDLVNAAAGTDVDPSGRAEAARALGRLGPAGQEGAATVLTTMARDPMLREAMTLQSDTFNVLLAVIEATDGGAPRRLDGELRSLATMPLPAAEHAGLLRRVVRLRCAAGAGLARSAYDQGPLSHCDPDAGGVIGQRARLASLIQRPLVAERRKAFLELAGSAHPTVREAALEAIEQHPELQDAGRTLLVQGLAAREPGVVATAAEAIAQHPDRVMALARSERLAALDPRAPAPTSHPAMEVPPEVSAALTQALRRTFPEDAVETRTALLDAAVALSIPEARTAATRACADANVTMRHHASRALRALGISQAACPHPSASPDGADTSPASPPMAHPTRVVFDVEGSKLGVVFEPALAPRAASRFVALARTGFYKGIVVHRVVPGYIAQFGDPGGDGYGGSGTLLRCETSPVPFDTLDVGVALAGRDTGSSQLFVTLGRYPKLDGDYARVGRAEGDWGAVAEGDVIRSVSVEE